MKCKVCKKEIKLVISGAPEGVCWGCVSREEKDKVLDKNLNKNPASVKGMIKNYIERVYKDVDVLRVNYLNALKFKEPIVLKSLVGRVRDRYDYHRPKGTVSKEELKEMEEIIIELGGSYE